MKRTLLILCLLATVSAWGQSAILSRTETFTSAVAGTTITAIGGRALFYRLFWYPIGAPASCTVAVDSSVDGTSWVSGDVLAGQTCTSSGSVTASSAAVYNYVRIHVTALSANKAVTVTLAAYEVNPVKTTSVDWSVVTGTPTTLGGYGITDAYPLVGGILQGLVTTATPSATQRSLDFVCGVSPTSFAASTASFWCRSADNKVHVYINGVDQTLVFASELWAMPGNNGVLIVTDFTTNTMVAVAAFPGYNQCTDAVGTDAYACTLSPAITAYTTGAKYRVKVGTSNTGASTLTLNAIAGGAKNIKKYQAGAKVDTETGDLISGQTYDFVYDGTDMVLSSKTSISVADMPVATATVAGAVPTPPNDSTKFLRGDATWAVPTASSVGTLFSQQYLAPSVTTTQYGSAGVNSFNATENNRKTLIPAACTARNLYLLTSSSQGAFDLVVTVRKGTGTGALSDTALTLTVNNQAAGIFSDTNHTVAFSAGDVYTWSVTSTGGASAGLASIAFQCN